jgi:hypothetical protein
MVNYLIEFILALLVLTLALQFWSIIKSRTYTLNFLGNQDELEKFIKVVGSDKLQRDATELAPVCGSWLQNMDVNSSAHFKALSTTRNVLLLPIAGIIVVSFYFLSPICGAANLVIFFLMAIPALSGPAKVNNLQLVRCIVLNLYRWSEDDPDEALRDCPKFLAITLATVSRLMERSESKSAQQA